MSGNNEQPPSAVGAVRNIRVALAYDGTDFHGWQKQPNALTVQGCLESAIERIVGQPVTVHGSGRTDAGVHALNQVANFKTACRVPCANLLTALNNLLPATVRVYEACEVPQEFHARYDARSKTYRYRILQAPLCSPFIWRFVWHHPRALDRRAMAAAGQIFEGEHDFTSLAGASGAVDATGQTDREALSSVAGAVSAERPEGGVSEVVGSMVRTIFSARLLWRSRTSMLIYEVRGSGFLHHMVRNLVGTLVEVGTGRLAPKDVIDILKARDRTLAGPTAPARGLCLVKVAY
jgi:tRNA pseudouridine38-40 synthase